MKNKKLPKDFESMIDPTIDQTEEILQISKASVFRLCKNGVLERYKVGGSTRIRKESIERLRSA